MSRFPRIAALLAAGGATEVADDFAGLDRLAELGRDELVALRTGLARVADVLRDVTPTDEVVETLQEVATAVGEVRTAEGTLNDREALAASLCAAIADPASAPIAGGPGRPRLGDVRAPAARTARSSTAGIRAVVAAGGVTVDSLADIAEQLHTTAAGAFGQLSGQGRREGEVRAVVSLQTQWPAELTLGRDPARNAEILDGRLAPTALTASGGICAPVAVDYSIPTFATAERPLRDGLPRFGADRGGVIFTPPPALSSLASATAVWTEATDVSPGGSTKPVATIACTDPTTVLVDAIPTRLRVGNFLARFNPEQQAAAVETAIAAAARIAELNLLTSIDAHSTEATSGALLGATRDLLATVDLVVAAMRYRQRVPRSTMMRVVLPEFARDMIRADIAKQLATDASQAAGGALAVSDEQIDAWFTVRGIRPIWTLDGRAAKGSAPTYPLQGFAAQTADAAVTAWPAKVVFNVFPEGAFVFLDGGRLDLGVVRDSTLNGTNDAELMFEPFEQVAFRGIEALKVVATVSPTGGSAGTVTPA